MASSSSNDGFVLVKSKKNRAGKTKSLLKSRIGVDTNEEITDAQINELENILQDYKSKLEFHDSCEYWLKFKENLKNFIKFEKKQLKIKSYGLGSLENNFNSRYQFVLLVLIIDELKECIVNDGVELYDPAFTNLDKYIITKKYQFKISDLNDEAKYVANSDTLLYMPHCGKPLYNNLLHTNWSIDSLNRLYLIGNSFRTIANLYDDNLLSTQYRYIYESMKFMNVISLNEDCEYTNAFSDLTLTSFSPINESFENDLGLPVYEDGEEIIFALKS